MPTHKFGTPGAPRRNHPIASPLTRPHMRSLMCGPSPDTPQDERLRTATFLGSNSSANATRHGGGRTRPRTDLRVGGPYGFLGGSLPPPRRNLINDTFK